MGLAWRLFQICIKAPSLQELAESHTLQEGLPQTQLVNSEVESKSKAIIKMKGLSWKYEGSAEDAIQGIDLEVAPGEVVIITGPSGAGKTTLCRTTNGLIPHFFRGDLRGNVTIADRSEERRVGREWR